VNPVERLWAIHRKRERLAVGLMSGMSMDGLDLALVRLAGAPPTLKVDLVAADTVPYDEALVTRLRAAVAGTAAEACRLSFDLAERWAGEVLGFLGRARTDPKDVDFLGSHGQTLHHTSRAQGGGRASTLQVGDGDVLAEKTGLLVVSDFRARDVAAGGEGAPLIPYADWCLWGRPGLVSACVNLGSIANVTVVTERSEDVLAFDMGPANALIDGFARGSDPAHGGIDRDGQISAAGRVDARLLAAVLARRAAFLDAPPPKSAGFGDFGPALAADLEGEFASVSPPDRVRTAVEVTAVCVARGFARHVKPRFPALGVVRFSGGGTRNPTLMRALADHLRPLGIAVESLPDDWSKAKEAVGFALLADATLRGAPSNLPGATGAARVTVLGKISLAR
jgi:anhydro-N-acetylmuramic acid kinase